MVEGLCVGRSLRVSSAYQQNQTHSQHDSEDALLDIREHKHWTYWLLPSSNGLVCTFQVLTFGNA